MPPAVLHDEVAVRTALSQGLEARTADFIVQNLQLVYFWLYVT